MTRCSIQKLVVSLHSHWLLKSAILSVICSVALLGYAQAAENPLSGDAQYAELPNAYAQDLSPVITRLMVAMGI